MAAVCDGNMVTHAVGTNVLSAEVSIDAILRPLATGRHGGEQTGTCTELAASFGTRFGGLAVKVRCAAAIHRLKHALTARVTGIFGAYDTVGAYDSHSEARPIDALIGVRTRVAVIASTELG